MFLKESKPIEKKKKVIRYITYITYNLKFFSDDSYKQNSDNED